MPEIDYEQAGSIAGMDGAQVPVWQCSECSVLVADRDKGGHAKWHGDNRLRLDDPETGRPDENPLG